MRIEKLDFRLHNEIIQNIWLLRLEKEKVQEGYFFFPDNHAELLVSLKGQFSRSIIGCRKKTDVKAGESYLTKTRSRGMVLQADEDLKVLMIKINPLYLNHFSDGQPFRQRDDVREFLLPATLRWAWRQALILGDSHTLITVFESLLTDLVKKQINPIDELIKGTIALIRKHKGEIKVKRLYELFGICKSTLELRFSREVGLSPKEFCKIEKLNHFLKNYNRFNEEMTLTQLTFKSGYYDQSHLIKDFKYYVDESPRRFLNNANKIMLYA